MAKKKSHATAASLLASGGQGSDPAQLRRLLGSTEYRKLVSQLHGQGLSVKGYTPGVPLSLQPRLNKSLAAEAAKTIGDAYKPADLELSTAEANVKNISAKRAADNKVYASWVQSTNAAFAAGNAASTTAMLDKQRQNHMDYITATQQVQSFGTENDKLLSAAREAGQSKLGTAEQQGAVVAQGAATNSQLIGSLGAQAVAGMASKDNANAAADLKTIGESKLKLAAEKGAKASELLTNLKQNEISKAEQQQSIAASREALNQKTGLEKLKLTVATKKADADRDSREAIANLKADVTREGQRANTQAKIDSFVAKTGYTPKAFRALPPAKRQAVIAKVYKQTHKGAAGTGTKVLTPEQQRVQRKQDTAVVGTIQSAAAGLKAPGFLPAGSNAQAYKDAISQPPPVGLGVKDPTIARYLFEKYHNHKVSAATASAIRDLVHDPASLSSLGL